eukprot:12866456-Alexandrium_andersonii.AAC.1
MQLCPAPAVCQAMNCGVAANTTIVREALASSILQSTPSATPQPDTMLTMPPQANGAAEGGARANVYTHTDHSPFHEG